VRKQVLPATPARRRPPVGFLSRGPSEKLDVFSRRVAMQREEYIARGPAIRQLFREVFNREQAESVMNWRYAEVPSWDEAVRVKLLESDGKVLAHYGSTAVDFADGTGTLRGAFSSVAMTHPSLQGQGVWPRLVREHEEELRDAGYDFIFVCPPTARYSDAILLKKCGWLPVADIVPQYFDLEAATFQPAAAETDFDDLFERFDYDALTDRDGLCATRRTRAYLRWRYTAHPLNDYRNVVLEENGVLKAYAVVKFYKPQAERFADVVDFFAFDPAALLPLFRQVLTFCRDSECSGVALWAFRHQGAHHELARAGFRFALPVTYLTFRPLTPRAEKLRTFTNWWLTMGDSDIY
jgi:predicted N-acetyltransferase YhbS